MFIIHYASKAFLSQMSCTTGLVSSKSVAQMYEEEVQFGNFYLKNQKFGTFDPSELDL